MKFRASAGMGYFLLFLLLSIPTLSIAQNDMSESSNPAPGSATNLATQFVYGYTSAFDSISLNAGFSLGANFNHEFLTTNTAPAAVSSGNKNACDENGMPILPSTGAKVETYPIFALPGEMGLRYALYYNTAGAGNYIRPREGARPKWSSNIGYSLDTYCNGASGTCNFVTIYRPDGSAIIFRGTPSGTAFSSSSGSNITVLTRDSNSGNFTFHDEDATTQIYSAAGALISIKDVTGVGWTINKNSANGVQSTTITHTNGQSFSVAETTNGSGQSSSNYTDTITDPSGQSYVVNYGSNYSPNALPSDVGSINYPGSPSTVISFKYQAITSANTRMNEVDYNGVPYAYTTYDFTAANATLGWATSTYLADNSNMYSDTYNRNMRKVTITNPLGHVSVQTYNATNGTTGVINPDVGSVSNDAVQTCGATENQRLYDNNGNLSETIDNNGNIHKFIYAINGQLQTETEAYGTSAARTTDYMWDANASLNRKTQVTVEGWSRTVYLYTAQNRLLSVEVTNLSPNGMPNQTLTTSYGYTYYPSGMVHTMSVMHPSPSNSDTDVSTYDSLGNLISFANGLDQVTTYSNYNNLNEVGRIVGANGDATTFTYDSRGRLSKKTTSPYGIAGSWVYSYDGFGLLYTLTGPDHEATTWNRNAVMRVTGITHNDKDGASGESFAYDLNGDVTSHSIYRVVNGSTDVGSEVNATYDALGRLYQAKGQNGQVLTYAYDGNGNISSKTDAIGFKTSYQYDALDRLTRTINNNGGITQSLFDLGNNVVSKTDPRGLVTTYAYDGLGQLWQQVSPDSGTTRYTFDSYGRQASAIRADGVQSVYSYDAINRTVSQSAGVLTRKLVYDNCTNGLGRLCSTSDGTGATSYSYTPEGWVAGKVFLVAGTSYALGYNYDGEGRLIVVDYPDNNKAIYYRTNGMVSSILLEVGSSYLNGATGITYRPADLALASWKSSNGLANTLTYDEDLRLTGISVPGLQNLAFGYDNANRLINIANGMDASATQTLSYNALSRLIGVSSTADNESYQYDPDGNRSTGSVNGAMQTYTISPTSNRLASFQSSLSASYGYDAQGNTTTVNGGSAYQYDAFGRLISAGGAANYIDPEGQRLRKAGGSTGVTYFAPDTRNNLMAENDNGAWSDYIRLDGRLIERISGGQVFAIHADQLGRPEEVTNASQAIVWRAQNFPFGRNVTVANGMTMNLGFPGQYYDAETWTWNNGYRDYNSGFGRYLESDPVGLNGGVNTYAYVGGNPVSRTDPIGLCDKKPNCNTVLPNGQTIGQVVQNAVANIQNAAAYDVGFSELATFIATVGSRGPIDFKNNFGPDRTGFLGAAGNFAYGAIASGVGYSQSFAEFGAGAYAASAGKSNPNNPYHEDNSAAQNLPAGYATDGCTQ